MGVVKIVILLLVVAAIATVVLRLQRARTAPVRFTPVEELPRDIAQQIDLALAQGRKVEAIRLYRGATGAGLVESKAAIDTRAWNRGG